MPSRAELTEPGCRLVSDGGPYKADLLEVDLGAGPLMVKDYARKRMPVRWIGRRLIRREYEAYRRLEGVPGVPELVGLCDAHALVLRKVAGRPLDDPSCPPVDGAEIFQRLLAVVGSLHRRGLVHWDLRTRKNVVVDPERAVWVLDLASAVWLRPGGWLHRSLFPWLQRIDRAAILKWKAILQAGAYTAEERLFLKRFQFWRSLWIFHLPSKPGA